MVRDLTEALDAQHTHPRLKAPSALPHGRSIIQAASQNICRAMALVAELQDLIAALDATISDGIYGSAFDGASLDAYKVVVMKAAELKDGVVERARQCVEQI